MYKTLRAAEDTTETNDGFQRLVNKISIDRLIEINRIYTYDDVGIYMMEYCMQICTEGSDKSTQQINASSLMNFISTGLHDTELKMRFDWNGNKTNHTQKPDAVFEVKWNDESSSSKSAYIYYECDALSKGVRNEDLEKIAVKLYQDTTGCHFINPEVPAITVRSNLFNGPDMLVEGDDKFTKLVKEADADERERLMSGNVAEQALTFLYSLCVAHLWVVNQIFLVFEQQNKGALYKIARPRDTEKYDLHMFIGQFKIPPRDNVQMFNQQLKVGIQNSSYSIPGAAPVQVVAIERFTSFDEFKHQLQRLKQHYHDVKTNTNLVWNTDATKMSGLIDINQLWRMVTILQEVFGKQADDGVLAGAWPLNGIILRDYATWNKITQVLGNFTVQADTSVTKHPWDADEGQSKYLSKEPEFPATGKKNVLSYVSNACDVILYPIEWPKAPGKPHHDDYEKFSEKRGPLTLLRPDLKSGPERERAAKNVVQDIVALYHGVIIANIYIGITKEMKYKAVKGDKTYLGYMKTLKERCKRNGSSILSRAHNANGQTWNARRNRTPSGQSVTGSPDIP